MLRPRSSAQRASGSPAQKKSPLNAMSAIAQLGAKVTLVEKKRIGGTCLNVGCIPTKALLHSAELYQKAKNGASAGVIAENVALDWDGVQNYRRGLVDRLVGGVSSLLEANGVEAIKASA